MEKISVVGYNKNCPRRQRKLWDSIVLAIVAVGYGFIRFKNPTSGSLSHLDENI